MTCESFFFMVSNHEESPDRVEIPTFHSWICPYGLSFQYHQFSFSLS